MSRVKVTRWERRLAGIEPASPWLETVGALQCTTDAKKRGERLQSLASLAACSAEHIADHQ